MSDHLLFSLNTVHYAIDANAVREIFWLPELFRIDEAPSYFAGVINLRGRILPVMSLAERFLHPRRPVSLTDRVIVLEVDEVKIGIMVSEVHDVVHILPEDTEPLPRFNRDAATAGHFIAGEAKVNGSLWMILDLPNLIDAPDTGQLVHEEMAGIDLFQQLPAAEREIFQTRARQLAQADDNQSTMNHVAYVIILLGLEYFAVAMSEVREFCHARQVTPIPCCPRHIVGNMNLRGDILTLVDVRPALMLNMDDGWTEIMVVESGGLRVGVPVNTVLDVVFSAPGDHLPLPSHANELNQDYCSGALAYHDRIACILDMKSLLSKGGLEVDEEV